MTPRGGATWTLARAPEGLSPLSLLVLSMDVPGRPVNVITREGLEELVALLDAPLPAPCDGLLVASGKAGGFIAGADIEALRAIEDPREGEAAAALGQDALRRLATLGVPSVAAIHGACVGGGAELALWCTGRVASTSDRTRIGFPEVRLGIVPGFGGTQRLPHVVGLRGAVDLATSGRLLPARRALAAGLVDSIVHEDHLLAEAAAHVARLRGEGRRPRRQLRLLNLPGARHAVAGLARRKVLAAAGRDYPAPAEALRLAVLGAHAPLEAGLAEEARTLGRLVASPTCRSLLHVQSLTRRAEAGGTAPSRGGLVAVLGAGVMGAGIAGVAAGRGLSARLRDVDAAALARGVGAAMEAAQAAVRNAHDRRLAEQAARDRMAWSLRLDGLAAAEVLIEAVVEREDVKKAVLREAEGACARHALLATNTSALSVTRLAESLAHPARFVGLHFFNPVPRMPLVEVIPGSRTSAETVERARGFVHALGKHPVVVKDSPGFLVNRVLMPYFDEAFALVEEGAAVTEVDAAARAFGMPMGPFRVLDEVGLDVARHVAATFAAAFPERFAERPLLAKLVAEGRLGVKTSGGFYDHAPRGARAPWKGLPAARAGAATGADAADRLVLRLADEGLRCLEEGVAEAAEDVDLATVFGMGFPAFRGGSCRFVDRSGAASVLDRLESLCRRHGERFRPSERLRAIAAGRPMYDPRP